MARVAMNLSPAGGQPGLLSHCPLCLRTALLSLWAVLSQQVQGSLHLEGPSEQIPLIAPQHHGADIWPRGLCVSVRLVTTVSLWTAAHTQPGSVSLVATAL